MTEIRAIETRYKGYRFRSRLEARWAVFFDALDVPWEYEKEGFDLAEAGRYLPDFWLTRQAAWVEIKPLPPVWNRKAEALSASGQRVLVIYGEPGKYTIVVHENGTLASDHMVAHYFATGRRDSQELWVTNGEDYALCLNAITSDERYPIVGQELHQAYEAARSARFEHGENGRPSEALAAIDANRKRRREEAALVARQQRGEDVESELKHLRWLIRLSEDSGWANP